MRKVVLAIDKRKSYPAHLALLLPLIFAVSGAFAGSPSEQTPILYTSEPFEDPVAKLDARLKSRQTVLTSDPEHGYLAAVLKYLNVPASSQTLVFSKTSFQRPHIWPDAPRALYFNDNVYVGWVKGGDVIEFAAMDPQKGPIFYTLDQRKETARLQRQTDSCLQCHESAMTEGNPGLLVRSVFPDSDGMPIYSSGTFRISHESPIKERWGGWYVTGTHGAQRHMGNMIVRDKNNPEKVDFEKGANVTDLSKLFDTKPYLAASSDIVALMVLEHQAKAHNLITSANYLTRFALRDEEAINKALDRTTPGHSDSTRSRIKSACEPLIRYFLFIEEATLTAPVQGSTDYAKQFEALGPLDKAGRSLRDFDLKTRMFRYPCSYLIYSESFNRLPDEAKQYTYGRLLEILLGKDVSPEYAKLTTADRQAILSILRETKADLPDEWRR